MNRLYRLFLELKAPEQTYASIARKFSAFTVIQAKGYWQGSWENSIIVEIVAHHTDRDTIRTLAAELRDINRQDCVLSEYIKNSAELI